jgi:DNA-binding transcriptional ArsR family regulator
LANRTRLRILRELARAANRSVSSIGLELGLAPAVASVHLRTLAARGLLRAHRSGPWVHYSLEPDPSIPEAGALVRALRRALKTDARAVEHVYRLSTAFTHPRRQAVYEELRKGECTPAELGRRTGMSRFALRRHLAKLTERGFALCAAGVCRASVPPGRVAELLAELAPRTAR